ncbi:hypothetical protein CRT60_05970 [Azospirillum palustre]|uniref:Uncharacterized protein n=1 Tax=Azospirillum palustre TaxID=2044885 RepID=A0A2B8BLS3_9PROT|nr:hypothetical protein CRT60_05970 [Azospirillum palustre]
MGENQGAHGSLDHPSPFPPLRGGPLPSPGAGEGVSGILLPLSRSPVPSARSRSASRRGAGPRRSPPRRARPDGG